jgi:hypothetical protein
MLVSAAVDESPDFESLQQTPVHSQIRSFFGDPRKRLSLWDYFLGGRGVRELFALGGRDRRMLRGSKMGNYGS